MRDFAGPFPYSLKKPNIIKKEEHLQEKEKGDYKDLQQRKKQHQQPEPANSVGKATTEGPSNLFSCLNRCYKSVSISAVPYLAVRLRVTAAGELYEKEEAFRW